MIETLRQKKNWLFDMDGTLTHAIHDFDAMRLELGLPEGKPILEAMAELPESQANLISKQLNEMEYGIASQATAQPHSKELLSLLQKNQCRVGIVTRNGHGIAQATLAACDLDSFFTPENIISRDCCKPKPNPDGVQLLLSRWSADASSAVMVGDHFFDLEAGKRAGTTSVHLDVDGVFPWPDQTDFGVVSLQSLAALWY